MKKIYTLCLIMALSLGAYAQTKKIALLETLIGKGSTKVEGIERQMVRGELRNALKENGYTAVTRTDVDQLMEELKFQATGMVKDEQIKRVGVMTGASYICVSTLTKYNTEFYLEAYLIDVETGEYGESASKFGELENGKVAKLYEVCQQLAGELVGSSGGRSNYNGGSNRGYSGATNSVTDCQGHTYPVVKIGSQYWMAENLQCTKYDTQSERAGQTLTSSSITYAPYYTDGRYANTEYSGNLTNEQRKHLGLLYNWAAAMGYATESQAQNQTGSYSGRRQGICPNGWHLPNRADWNTLANALGGVPQTIFYGNVRYSNVGAKLKSRSGWYNGGNGTDDYGFSGLPAGGAGGNSVSGVGMLGYFWSSDAFSSVDAYVNYLVDGGSGLCESYNYKNNARSVRCLRD